MLNEQVRKLLVATLIVAFTGCGLGRGSVEPSSLWADATPIPGNAPINQAPAPANSPHVNPPYASDYAQSATEQPIAAPTPTARPASNAPPANTPPVNAAYNAPYAQNLASTNPAPYVTPNDSPLPYRPQTHSDVAAGNAPLQYAPEVVQPQSPYQQQYPPSTPPAGTTPAPAPPTAPAVTTAGPSPSINPPPASGALAASETVDGQASTLEAFEPARIVARVGSQYILAGDVLGAVNQMLAPHRDKMTDRVYEQQKELLVRRMVKQMIDTKLMYNSFLQEVPPDRLEEALGNIRKQAYSQYDETELPNALKKAKVNSAAELDAFLRKYGTSLQKQKQQYLELQLGRQAVRQNINANPEITHQEMLDYYRENAADFEFPAKTRWEKLTARYDKFPDRAQARYAIGVMGDQVRLGGAPLSAVAKRSSQGYDKEEGGYHDWTTKGSLKSEKIDQAIFGLPPGLLSDVIDDETGFHIVRVIERVEAGRTPFVEAQVEIKKKLLGKKRQEQITTFLKRLREETDVWTVFDDDPLPTPPTQARGPAPGRLQ